MNFDDLISMGTWELLRPNPSDAQSLLNSTITFDSYIIDDVHVTYITSVDSFTLVYEHDIIDEREFIAKYTDIVSALKNRNFVSHSFKIRAKSCIIDIEVNPGNIAFEC